jgi:hypothetical protein
MIARQLLCLPLLVVAFACGSYQSGYSIGAEDNGTTKDVKVGSALRLVLPADDWSLESTNTSALALKSTAVGDSGGAPTRIWLFDVKQAGDFVLRATGEAPCRRDTPPCDRPTARYEFKIRAR